MPEQLKPIHSQDDYREAMDKLGSYRAALIEAQRVADELDFLRVARIGQVPTENAVELADRLLSGEELQDDLGKRIAETARKIKTLGCPEQLEFVSATRPPVSDSAMDGV